MAVKLPKISLYRKQLTGKEEKAKEDKVKSGKRGGLELVYRHKELLIE